MRLNNNVFAQNAGIGLRNHATTLNREFDTNFCVSRGTATGSLEGSAGMTRRHELGGPKSPGIQQSHNESGLHFTLPAIRSKGHGVECTDGSLQRPPEPCRNRTRLPAYRRDGPQLGGLGRRLDETHAFHAERGIQSRQECQRRHEDQDYRPWVSLALPTATAI